MSGWAQVNGRDVLAAHPKKKAQFDNYYLQHFSLWLDIKIFFLTILKVFKSDDVEEGVIAETESIEEVALTDSTIIEIEKRLKKNKKKLYRGWYQ